MLSFCVCVIDPSLVSKLTNGKISGSYKKVDYEELKAITQIKSAAGLKSVKKIRSIRQLSKEKKDFNTLQQHKIWWKRELIRLNSSYKEKKNELHVLRTSLSWEQSSLKEFFDEVEEYKDFMKEDCLIFSRNTVKPVWDLREDIHIWLEENKEKIRTGTKFL